MCISSPSLKLELPVQYHLISGQENEEPTDVSSIYGTAVVTGLAQDDNFHQNMRIHIYLVCVLECCDRKKTNSGKSSMNYIKKWTSSRHKSADIISSRTCSIVEEVILHRPFISGHGRHELPFCLPIIGNIPVTSQTDIAKISYCLVATISSEDLKTSHITWQEISVIRQIWPHLGPASVLQHIRNYSGLNPISKIVLTQEMRPFANLKLPISAKIFVRPARRADRPSEYRCLAIRGIRWRVEEITKIMFHKNNKDQNLHAGRDMEDRESIREVATGLQKGYWKIARQLVMRECLERIDPTVEIPIDIVLPKGRYSSEVSTGCYNFLKPVHPGECLIPALNEIGISSGRDSFNAMITIEHRLNLNILISEDTFCLESHSLVDRKPLKSAHDAAFPLKIMDQAWASQGKMPDEPNLPFYEELGSSPPQYPI